MSLLVIKNDGIGDLILVSGLIGDLAKEYGPVDLITCAANLEIAGQIEGVRRVLAVSRDNIHFDPRLMRVGIHWVRMTADDRRVARHLRVADYNIALSLRRYIRQSSLILMSRVRARRRLCAWLYPTNLPRHRAEILSRGWEHFRGVETGSELSYYRAFVKWTLGLESRTPPMLGCAQGIRPMPEAGRIGLSLSGASAKWPASHWLELARTLASDRRTIVLFGGVDASASAKVIADTIAGTINFVGKLGFKEALPELQRLELLIGNDTGMTHYATLGTSRVLCILGGGTFGRFFPWPEDERQYVIFHALDCYDCDWSCLFPEAKCLVNISPGQVVTYVREILGGHAPHIRNLAQSSVRYIPGWRRSEAGKGKTAEIAPGCPIP